MKVWTDQVARIGRRRLLEIDGRFYLELNNKQHKQYRVEVPIETARRYYKALSGR